MKREIIKERSMIIRDIRDFFTQNGYLEVETPILSPYLIPEPTIEAFETTYFSTIKGEHQLYLTPSPEIYMKKLIAMGTGDIFQITKSFRNNEQSGIDHNPEFTMLEWYKMEITAWDNIQITEELFSYLLELRKARDRMGRKHNTAIPPSITPPFLRISVEDIFFETTGISLAKNQNVGNLREAALSKGYSIQERGESWESIFNRIFLTDVEPSLPKDKGVVLFNYPSKIECLAKNIPGTPWKERWELYAGGTELANCFSEERDRKTVSALLDREYAKAASNNRVIPDMDESFSNMFTQDYPECSGTAMGVDRLVKILTGADSLRGVILFPIADILP